MGINDTILTNYYREINSEEKLSIHQLLLDFFQLPQQDSKAASDFLKYCSSQMSEAACDEALRKTKSQHKSKLWHEMRYGRITASKAYESAQCQTMHVSLVQCIMGASSLKDTNVMKRGKK
ncbi:hypothetical protein AVEN_143707-1 [Araneus ventricosus]|uniref:Uncharacterized protein n=1 Tax=Araneus ventricosus TaxID=182803 RepID=A0A4Y2ANP3_ARAVE|nr:hypothetical protein AVEN_143707-1 [Araneus ventricosus]